MPRRIWSRAIRTFIERMDKTAGKIIIDGNAACGMGAVFAGVTVVAWYPITPSTSSIEAATDLLKKLRVTPEGKATFAVVQAEDELAAIGMVLGAGWAGARAMTATSGPGMSLMAEFSGLGYLRRDSRRHSQRAAHWTLDGHADAHAAGRRAFRSLTFARRHQASAAAAGVDEGMLRADAGGL